MSATNATIDKDDDTAVYPDLHGEFVDPGIHAPFISLNDVGFEDHSLRLLLEEIGKVVDQSSLVGTGKVRDGGEKDRLGGVTGGHLFGFQSGQGVVPEAKERLDFGFGNGRNVRGRSRGEETASRGVHQARKHVGVHGLEGGKVVRGDGLGDGALSMETKRKQIADSEMNELNTLSLCVQANLHSQQNIPWRRFGPHGGQQDGQLWRTW